MFRIEINELKSVQVEGEKETIEMHNFGKL